MVVMIQENKIIFSCLKLAFAINVIAVILDLQLRSLFMSGMLQLFVVYYLLIFF